VLLCSISCSYQCVESIAIAIIMLLVVSRSGPTGQKYVLISSVTDSLFGSMLHLSGDSIPNQQGGLLHDYI